jgi:hypothetical protein
LNETTTEFLPQTIHGTLDLPGRYTDPAQPGSIGKYLGRVDRESVVIAVFKLNGGAATRPSIAVPRLTGGRGFSAIASAGFSMV